jgi:hypothetical protein
MAITGHKGGLGKALFDHFKAKSFVVSGFSRTNGYDISAASCREQLVQNISECDLFINNAHSGWGQVELLYSVFEIWNNKPKHIINIGSNSGDGTKTMCIIMLFKKVHSIKPLSSSTIFLRVAAVLQRYGRVGFKQIE